MLFTLAIYYAYCNMNMYIHSPQYWWDWLVTASGIRNAPHAKSALHIHTECNIVLPFLSSVNIVSKRMHVSSHFLVILHHSRFLTPTAVTKFQLEPP